MNAKSPSYWILHCHHEILFEPATEPIENRIAYILSDKPKAEQAIRLRAMRPIPAQVWLEYQRIEQPALAEYERIRRQARAEYERITQPTLAEYLRIEQPAWEEYLRITQPAWEEYRRIKQQAWEEYKRITQQVHDAHCTVDCPWDGRTLFPKEGQ